MGPDFVHKVLLGGITKADLAKRKIELDVHISHHINTEGSDGVTLVCVEGLDVQATAVASVVVKHGEVIFGEQQDVNGVLKDGSC